MFLLAAKLGIAFMLTADGPQAARLSEHELTAWNQVRPAIVTLYANGRASGVAALIDDAGYFVTHNSSVKTDNMIWGVTSSGRQITFRVVSQEKGTMLVLLKTDSWISGPAHPFRPPAGTEIENNELIAVLPSGPIRMAYGTRHKIGVQETTRRILPLTEVRFEAAPQLVGGALIFSTKGDFIGSLNATLTSPENQNMRGQANNMVTQQGGQGGQGGFAGGRGGNNRGGQYFDTGPGDMTVAYTVSHDYVRHVLEGFLSPQHTVEFAAMGVFCVDAVGGGAQIQQVVANSPADKAGLRPGDILQTIAGRQIQDQVAFATVMLQQKVGKQITVVVQRGQAKLFVELVPAKAAN